VRFARLKLALRSADDEPQDLALRCGR